MLGGAKKRGSSSQQRSLPASSPSHTSRLSLALAHSSAPLPSLNGDPIPDGRSHKYFAFIFFQPKMRAAHKKQRGPRTQPIVVVYKQKTIHKKAQQRRRSTSKKKHQQQQQQQLQEQQRQRRKTKPNQTFVYLHKNILVTWPAGKNC